MNKYLSTLLVLSIASLAFASQVFAHHNEITQEASCDGYTVKADYVGGDSYRRVVTDVDFWLDGVKEDINQDWRGKSNGFNIFTRTDNSPHTVKTTGTVKLYSCDGTFDDIWFDDGVVKCDKSGPNFSDDGWDLVETDTFNLDYTPQCVIDMCPNLEGDQEEVPQTHYLSEDQCLERTPVCTEELANNYDEVGEGEISDNSVCEFDDKPYCLDGETITIPVNQEAPEGSISGVCEEPEVPVGEPKRDHFTAPSKPSAPSGCPNPDVVKPAENAHVYRKGDQAEVKWYPSGGDRVNIYYKQNNSPVWQYSVIGVQNNGSFLIEGLGTMDITFAVEQTNGCSGGVMSNVVVDGNTHGWTLFR